MDGGDVMALLNSGGVGEGVYGDWEQVLLEDQYRKREVSDAKPLDPPATTQQDDGEQLSNHESATTDEQLLSSLSSLDLSARSYLRTLLALPVETSIIDYIHQNRYTEDVYALPKEIRRVLEEAEQRPGVSPQDSRRQAVRRLEMVLSHLSLAEESLVTSLPPTSTFPRAMVQPGIVSSSASLNSPDQTRPLSTQRQDPAHHNFSESTIAAQHMSYRRRSPQRLPSETGNDRENAIDGDVLDSTNGKRSPLSDSLQRRMDEDRDLR